jgi:hypothetical protein
MPARARRRNCSSGCSQHPSPSGYEAPAAGVWREAASVARLRTDGIGSSIAEIGDEDARPLLARRHIDEIGLVATHVGDLGVRREAVRGRRVSPLHTRLDRRSQKVAEALGFAFESILKSDEGTFMVFGRDAGASRPAGPLLVTARDPRDQREPCRSLPVLVHCGSGSADLLGSARGFERDR